MKQFKNLIEVVEYFKADSVCRQHLASLRWGNGMACTHCGSVNFYSFKDGKTYKCKEKECNLKFNVKTGTIFENTKIPLQKWFAALYLITSHKKGISSIQVGKDLSVTQKTAWFMMHRLREMFSLKIKPSFEGVVEVDETYVGGKGMNKHQSDYAKAKRKAAGKKYEHDKFIVMGCVKRDGDLYLKHIPTLKGYAPQKFVIDVVQTKSTVYTDELALYGDLNQHSFTHESVNHAKGEYAVGERHTNTIEGAFVLTPYYSDKIN